MSATPTKFCFSEISGEILRLASIDGWSLAARVRPSNRAEVVALVSKSIAQDCEDLEVAVLAALARVRVTNREMFIPTRPKRRRWNNHDLFPSAVNKKETAR